MPSKGTIQVTLFNPLGTVVKMFVVMYDLSDMPPNSQTFLRQRTLYMPSEGVNEGDMQKWLRYLVHLRYTLHLIMVFRAFFSISDCFFPISDLQAPKLVKYTSTQTSG